MTTHYAQVGIQTRDPEASARYLAALLGPSATTLDLEGPNGERMKVVSAGKGAAFDLYSGEAPAGESPSPCLIQYCLGVEDVDASYRAALAAGASSVEAPTDAELKLVDSPERRLKFRFARITDPDGAVCELVNEDWRDGIG